MHPLFIITAPRSKATLLERLVSAHTKKIIPTGPLDEVFRTLRGIERGIEEREMADGRSAVKCDLAEILGRMANGIPMVRLLDHTALTEWDEIREKIPGARFLFLKRDREEIETSMHFTQHVYKWVPWWAKCGGCAATRVKNFHESVDEYVARNPEQSAVFWASDLHAPEKILEWIGVTPNKSKIEKALSEKTGSYRDLVETGNKNDPFHPLADEDAFGALDGAGEELNTDAPNPFNDDDLFFAVDDDDFSLEVYEKARWVPKIQPSRKFQGKTLVTTLRYGDHPYIHQCARSQEEWADNHGYKYKVYGGDEGLKCQKFSTVKMMKDFVESEYDRMIFLDADIYIHPRTPDFPIFTGMSVVEDKNPTEKFWSRFKAWREKHYPNLTLGSWTYFNSGMIAIDKRAAKIFLRETASPWIIGCLEQHQFNIWAFRAWQAGMKLNYFPMEWNRLPFIDGFGPAWFVHLAGNNKEKRLETAFSRGMLPRRPRTTFREIEPEYEKAICYPWLPVRGWDDLRMSLRSIHENFDDKECPILIYGTERPSWLDESNRVRFIEIAEYQFSNDAGMFQARMRGYQAAKKVLWMNDDIFLTAKQGWEDFEVALTEGTIGDDPETVNTITNTWARAMALSAADLQHNGREGKIMRFATHTPILYEIEKVREIFKRFYIPHKGAFANLYHNWHKTPNKPCKDKGGLFDGKRFHDRGNFFPSRTICEKVIARFPNPAPWEKDIPIELPKFTSRVAVASFNEDLSWCDNTEADIVIYDAGGKGRGVKVPNDGREASTYVRHILSNWDSLKEYEIFCQADPFDHCEDFMERLEKREWEGTDFYPLGTLIRGGKNTPNGPKAKKIAKKIGVKIPDDFDFCYGAQFAVSRETVLARGREFYERLLEAIIGDRQSPWGCEQIWRFIFTSRE